ncbi:MAG: methyltransferase domain-containing protein [Planctomycetota bacterium]
MLADIQNILQCPVSGESLRLMVPEDIVLINSKIRPGTLRHLDGTLVKHEIQCGYITQSEHLVYPVKEGIIVLLSNWAIVLDHEHINVEKEHIMSLETDQVQSFYNETGWQKTEEGKYEDTARFVDNRPVLYVYFSTCNNRIKKYMKKKGKYLVDVACGPIHYDSYRAMSDGYNYRICIDVSFQALREAKKQMGDRGIYMMADITNMPLQDESVDDVISLHTLYHVPADRQGTALKEIHRILKPAATGVVIYSWGNHSKLMRAAMMPIKVLDCLRSLTKKNNAIPNTSEPLLYSHRHDYSFLMEQSLGFDIDVNIWSSINSAFTRTYIPDGRTGALLLKIIGKLEDYFPHASGRLGEYPLFIIKKSSARYE